MTPEQAAAAFGRKAAALKAGALAADKQIVAETQTAFRKRSSGTLSSARLKQMGHPYSRRLGGKIMRTVGNIDPTVINAQSGKLRRSWKKSLPRMSVGVIRSSVINTSEEAKYMLGTKTMIGRRIDIYIAAQMKRRRMLLHRFAVRKALRS